MGMLVDGVWVERWHDTSKTGGRFDRKPTHYHNWVTADGSPGPTGDGGFPAEPGRYHLYVSLACPWAHRTVIFRALKRLDDVVTLSVVSPTNHEAGWTFNSREGSTGDAVYGAEKLADLYLKADPRYTGRVSVPVLWDKQRHTIVNNESSEIIRMLNAAFDAFTDMKTDYYPPALRGVIDEINALVYPNINNGVYRCGFATTQVAYDESFRSLFAALNKIEGILSRQRYLVGATQMEADWRLFTTLVRFDAVYYSHFKCNLRRIRDYSNLSNYLRDLYQVPRIAATVSIEQIKRHYYGSQRNVNPTGIVPLGPELDFESPHDRERFAAG
ncbi:MAG: glutathione S-transferase family protein [Rhizobiales bacterium]|nr:glutathione S-transferase family protein [Hyphomicrobiales bacterium]